MKFEQVNAWKTVSKVAAVLALGAVATAQAAGNEAGRFIRGRPLFEVSMEDDIHAPQAGRKAVLDLIDQGRLELVFKMRAFAGTNPHAIIPTMDDLAWSILLVNGTPGAMAVIHLDQAPEVRRAGGTKIVGFFDENGTFEATMPSGFQSRGVFAHGEEVTWFGLVKKDMAGHAVRTSKLPVSEEVDLEEQIARTYSSWVQHLMDLEFRTDARMRRASLEEHGSAVLSASSPVVGGGHTLPGSGVDGDITSGAGTEEPPVFVAPADPQGGRRAGEKIALQRPARPVVGGGHALPGSGVDGDITSGAGTEEPPVFVAPADPQGGRRAGEKIALQRPARPVVGGGHTLPGSGVEDDITSGTAPAEPPVPADPKGARRAGKKIALQRPSLRDDHILQRKL